MTKNINPGHSRVPGGMYIITRCRCLSEMICSLYAFGNTFVLTFFGNTSGSLHTPSPVYIHYDHWNHWPYRGALCHVSTWNMQENQFNEIRIPIEMQSSLVVTVRMSTTVYILVYLCNAAALSQYCIARF